MAAASFETVAARNAGLIRKALKGAVLVGKYGTAPAITTLVATSGQIDVPNTYESCGWLGEDGATMSRDREFSEVRGWGSASYLRRDINSEDRTLQFVALESKRRIFELRDNVDLSAAQVSAAGELKWDMPDRPDPVDWRVIVLGVDGVGATRIYFAKVFHKMSVSELGDETWGGGDDPIQYDMTMSATPDDTLGTLGTEFLFGPGVLAKAVAMGFTVAT